MKTVLRPLLLFLAIPFSAGMAVDQTYVLVHGALFTENGWDALKDELDDQTVESVNVPGRADDGVLPIDVTLQSAVDKLCSELATIDKKVVLVGHSQGGAVITQAFSDCRQYIKALVYVAAVVPSSGKTAFEELSEESFASFGQCVVPDAENGVFIPVDDTDLLKDKFLHDVAEPLASRSVNGMVPEPMGIGSSTLEYSVADFRNIPKFYVLATADRIVLPADQREYIESAGISAANTFEMQTSHSPFLADAPAVADALRKVPLIVDASILGKTAVEKAVMELVDPTSSVRFHIVYDVIDRVDLDDGGFQLIIRASDSRDPDMVYGTYTYDPESGDLREES